MTHIILNLLGPLTQSIFKTILKMNILSHFLDVFKRDYSVKQERTM